MVVFDTKMRMKILIHGINFSPELIGVGKYTSDMAVWLASRGHSVRVICAPPYYPAWKVLAPFSGARYARTQWQGVDVWRCPLWVPKRPGGLKRLLHLGSFAFFSLPQMLRQLVWRPDVVWVVEPALACAPAALFLARLTGAKAWLHIQDFEVDAAFDLGLVKGRALKQCLLAIEAWLMRRFDAVSTISKRMGERARAKGIPNHKMVSFPNWIAVNEFAHGSQREILRYRQKLGIQDGALVALYSGNMGNKQGLEILADLARRYTRLALNDHGEVPVEIAIVFVYCGEGPGRTELMRGCQQLDNVRFLDLQPLALLPSLLALADIHLLPQRADAADLVMPSKLTGMLASGRPIVATAKAGTELADVVHQCGIVVPPEDSQALAYAVQKLAKDRALRTQLGMAGRRYASEYLDAFTVLSQFENALFALCGMVKVST